MEWKRVFASFQWRGGIRHRLLWIGLLFLSLALLANTIAGSLYTRRQIKRAAVQLQTEVASKVANQISDIMERKTERLMDLAVALSLYEPGVENQRLLSLLFVKNDRAFTGIAILDASGREIIKVSERRIYLDDEFSDASGEDYFRRAVQGSPSITPVYTTEKAEPYVKMGVPITRGPGFVVGVAVAEVNLTFLWQIIGDVKFSEAGNTYLVDRQGNLIAHVDPSLVLRRTNLRDHFKVRSFLQRPEQKDPNPGEEGIGLMGQRVLSTYAPVRGVGWAVVLTEPVDFALADLSRMQRYAILLLLVGALIGSVLIVWVSNKITAPIRELHRGVEIIRQGNLDHRVNIATGDEIELLAKEFNEMAGELENSYGTLEQRVEQRTRDLAALYDVTKTVNQSLDLEAVLVEVIKKFNEIFRFDTTRIYLADPQTGEQHARASYLTSAARDTDNVKIFARGEGIVGQVAETGEPMIFEDLRTDPRYKQNSTTKNTQLTGNAFLAVFPIMAKFKSVGTILCNGKEPRRLTTVEIQLITSMASQIGVAVENARLYSETKQKSMEIEKAYREMQAAARAKRDFLAAMSHELRTPLNVIIGNADLCKDGFFGGLSAKQKESIEKILRYSRILLKLISDVLTLSKIEARKMSLDLSTFDVREVMDQVQNYVEQLNHKGRVKFSWNIPARLPPLTSDALKLEEILQNLIGNAYKFTPSGSIEVSVRDLQHENRIEFAVADTGIGMKVDNLDKIFDEFHQLEEAHTGHYFGVGLGLSIIKKYLELMLGDIQVQSEPGVGSTFTFTLPYSLSEAVAARATTAAPI
jgi:signal transduction histidine kinase